MRNWLRSAVMVAALALAGPGAAGPWDEVSAALSRHWRAHPLSALFIAGWAGIIA